MTVTCDLTPLTPAAASASALDEFAAGYTSFIRSWEKLISGHLT
ncbi:hypothetical protein ACFVJ8_35235 [Streptomyces yangpuensis]